MGEGQHPRGDGSQRPRLQLVLQGTAGSASISKWYGEPLPSAQALCPKTVALSQSHADGQRGDVRAAAARRQAQRAIAIRSPARCAITSAWSRPIPTSAASTSTASSTSWRDGEDVLFDETFIHSAPRTRPTSTRIILFCDVERPLHTRWMTAVNRWVSAQHHPRVRDPERRDRARRRAPTASTPCWGAAATLKRLKRKNRTRVSHR